VTASTGTATTPLLYDGQYLDAATGFYYLRARWYDAGTDQFTSVDPDVAETGEPYAYADDNPLDGTDPSGLSVAMSQSALAGVVQWALANVSGKKSPGNNGFTGDDCTDFASRALHKGGGDPETGPPGGGVLESHFVHSDDHYWYRFGWGLFFTAESNSWAAAYHLYHHLSLIGSKFPVQGCKFVFRVLASYDPNCAWNEVEPGDIIFANWHNASPTGIDHTGVIVIWTDDVQSIAQHSYDRVDSMYDWMAAINCRTHRADDTYVWVVHPNEG
jgi:RHS repeat-associated protein